MNFIRLSHFVWQKHICKDRGLSNELHQTVIKKNDGIFYNGLMVKAAPTSKTLDRDEKYLGASNVIETLGHGNAYGWLGSGLGLGLGAIFSGMFIKADHKFVKSVTERCAKWNIPLSGKGVLIVAGALAGSQIFHIIGAILGYAEGAKTSGRGRAQFIRNITERNTLADRVEVLEAENDILNQEIGEMRGKYHERLDSRKAQGGHAAMHGAEKSADFPAQSSSR